LRALFSKETVVQRKGEGVDGSPFAVGWGVLSSGLIYDFDIWGLSDFGDRKEAQNMVRCDSYAAMSLLKTPSIELSVYPFVA